jgi:hypothetical protein
MTVADELGRAVAADDEAAIRAILSPLTEADRADLAQVARDVVKREVARGVDARQLGPMLVLAYGLLPVAEIRKLGWRSNHLRTGVADVLRRRSPERLGPIVAFLLEDVGGEAAWRTVRPLVGQGVMARPSTPAYTIAMLTMTRWRPASELLAGDPGLLELEVWRLFEVEGGGEDSLANYEKFYGDSWGVAFRAMADGDPAMRARLLDASLAALARDFATYRAGWFSRFHESLQPTDEERAQRADAYLGLLRSRVGPTVSFAVAALKRIDRAGLLAPETLLDRIEPVLSDAPAGTAKAGLGLVAGAAARSPDCAKRAAIVAAEGMRHPAVDVQRAAIAAIGKLVGGPDPELAAVVGGHVVDVAASARPAAVALVDRLGGRPAEPVVKVVIERAPVRIRTPTDPSRALERLDTVEALVDVAVSVLETGEPADDVERVLDGVRRLGDRQSPAFLRLTAPIAKRARTLLARRDSGPFSGFDPRSDVAGVLLAWSAGEMTALARAHGGSDPGAGAFLSARALETAEAVIQGQPAPALALPTHRGGWIEPGVLVDRLRRNSPVSRLDFIAAILRLAGDGRTEALADAADLPAETGAVLRYALDGDEAVGPTAPWWAAAARVRNPGFDDAVVARRHPDLGPEAARAATMQLRLARPTGTYERLVLDVQPPPVGTVPAEIPTALLLRDPTMLSWSGHSDPVLLRWVATIQPGYREPWAAVGSLLIGRNLDWWSADWGNRAFLEPFLDPWTEMGPHAVELLGIALGAKEAGERGLAADVCRVAVGDGRLDDASLARGLGDTVAVGLDRPQRWAQSLADAAAESDGHAATVAAAIGRSLEAVRHRPAGTLVPLLRLLDELLAQTGGSPVDEARPALEGLRSSGGQAGRLTRSILARAATGIG